MNITEVEINKINIVEDYYPRFQIDSQQVKLYRLNLEELPPIIISHEFILIDGAHRLQAYEIDGKKIIPAIIKDIEKKDILEESIKANSKHGKQLERAEKKDLAIKLIKNKKNNGESIAKLLAVSRQSVNNWTYKEREKLDELENNKVLQLYLRSFTHDEISEKLGIPRRTITERLSIGKNAKNGKIAEPTSLKYFDFWGYSSVDLNYGTPNYAGRCEGQIVENFLYYWTNLWGTVVDPMAGGGTTGDVCKTMYRRYQMYDINPLKSRTDILKHDIRDGYPEKAKQCDAIFLDPPYWGMKDEQYPDGSVSSLSRKKFIQFISKLAFDSYKTLKKGGVVGFLFQDIYKPFKGLYKEFDGNMRPLFTGTLFQEFVNVGFEEEYWINSPLSNQQYRGSDMKIAKENKVLLHINRHFIIFRKK